MKKNIFIAILIILLAISSGGWLFTALSFYLLKWHIWEMDFYLDFAKDGQKQAIMALNNHYYDYYSEVTDDSPYTTISNSHAKLVTFNIIQILKEQTGDDLGDDPKEWIKKYSGKNAEKTDAGSANSE